MHQERFLRKKAKGNIRILEEESPNIPVLICAFHAIKAFKTELSGLPLQIGRKHAVLGLLNVHTVWQHGR